MRGWYLPVLVLVVTFVVVVGLAVDDPLLGRYLTPVLGQFELWPTTGVRSQQLAHISRQSGLRRRDREEGTLALGDLIPKFAGKG
jgi:hypothetical protein